MSDTLREIRQQAWRDGAAITRLLIEASKGGPELRRQPTKSEKR